MTLATLEQDMAKGDNENSRLLIFPQAKHLEFPFKVVLPVSNDTSLTPKKELQKPELFFILMRTALSHFQRFSFRSLRFSKFSISQALVSKSSILDSLKVYLLLLLNKV